MKSLQTAAANSFSKQIPSVTSLPNIADELLIKLSTWNTSGVFVGKMAILLYDTLNV